jgi:hypothetical protein
MGVFDLFTNGTATATRGGGLMDRLSQECGWTPDMRQGNAIVHHFKGDAVTPQRSVLIVHPPGDEMAMFSCTCRATFNARSMTTTQLALFLARNNESVFGKWQIAIDSGQVTAHLRYTALVGGLTAEFFKVICVALLGEVAFVEEALHGQGML